MVCGLVAQVSFEPLTLAVFVFSLGYVAAESYCSVVPIMRQVSTPGHLRASSEKYKDFGLALQVQDVKREEKSYPSTNWLPE